MSTSLLYHGFGIRGYRHRRTEYVEGKVVVWIEQDPSELSCPVCGSADVIRKGCQERRFHMVPIGSKQVVVVFPVPRVACLLCGGVRQVCIPFALPRRSYTRAFERYALELSRRMTILDVARHLGVGWDIVKDIQSRYLTRRFARPKLGRLRQLAIDMSPAYIEAVQTNLPGTAIVFDHFHVIKLYNEKLSDLRRELQREVTEVQHKRTLKGTRWLLLKNPENLDERRNERQRLDEALRINKPLATAYYMKEDLRQLWTQADKAAATAFLDDWIARAQTSGIRMLQDFAKTLAGHRSGLLAYYDHRITTAALEGTNTKIRVLQRQAFGFRDMAFFKLKIMALHKSRIALVG